MKVTICKHDGLGALGGFYSGSVKEGKPLIIIDTEAMFQDGRLIFFDGSTATLDTEEKKRLMIETMMHEFGHALEEQLEIAHDEDSIEEAIASYIDAT